MDRLIIAAHSLMDRIKHMIGTQAQEKGENKDSNEEKKVIKSKIIYCIQKVAPIFNRNKVFS